MGRRNYRGNIQRFRLAVVYAAGLAICSSAGVVASRAQDAELSRKLTLKEAVNLAVANSRDLALARLQYGVMQRQIGVARSVFGEPRPHVRAVSSPDSPRDLSTEESV